jgi:hypothetical protein
MPSFVVFAMPRSRSAWLTRFLTYGDWQCGHDEARHCRSPDDIRAWLSQPCTGTVETAAAPFWRLLEAYAPDARIVTLRRPIPQVMASLRRAGLLFDDRVMTRVLRQIDAKLDQIEARLPNVLSVRFADLADEEVCAEIFQHCLPYRHDPDWWQALNQQNVQINLLHLVRYCAAHEAQLAKLAKTAKHRIVANMLREPREMDGVTFQHEPFRQFYRDAEPLFAEHLAQTGQSPDAHALKNLPLLEVLDDAGLLQIITARSNGRMFGYLMTVVGPTLDAADVLQGWHTIFFASPNMPGLGMKLQRAALTGLRERGVGEVIMRAGHRGSGPRLGAVYRRLGAEDFGQLYRLELA